MWKGELECVLYCVDWNWTYQYKLMGFNIYLSISIIYLAIYLSIQRQKLKEIKLFVPIYSPPGSSVHGDSPGKNTGVGCHALLQGIFPTWGLNLGLLHCWWILYHLSHQWSISTYIYRYLEYLVVAEYKEELEEWTKGQKSQLRGSFTD